jgi:hypothetical protein
MLFASNEDAGTFFFSFLDCMRTFLLINVFLSLSHQTVNDNFQFLISEEI